MTDKVKKAKSVLDNFGRAGVLATLSNIPSTVNRIPSLTNYPVNTALFASVRGAIAKKKVGVLLDKTLKEMAYYDTKKNAFFLGFYHISTLPRRAIIVHEAVHAGMDISKKGKMTRVDSEAAAYIAQCLYARIRTKRLGDVLSAKDAPTKRIMQEAWDVALDIMTGPGNYPNLGPLKQAILAHPIYRNQKAANFDGV